MSAIKEWYERHVLAQLLERGMAGVDPLRGELLREARGRVLEIGFGTGTNLPFYPSAVEHLVAVEPSEGLASIAKERLDRWRAQRKGTRTDLIVQSGSRALPIDAGSFDVVVITFVLCSVKRVPELLDEVRRALSPTGTLLVAEHVLSSARLQARAQRTIAPLWRAAVGGCDPARPTRAALERAGFDTSEVRDTRLELPWMVSSGVVGRARLS